jgi:hypothetical protein
MMPMVPEMTPLDFVAAVALAAAALFGTWLLDRRRSR